MATVHGTNRFFSQESKVSKFCMEAGFMRVVEVGQYS